MKVVFLSDDFPPQSFGGAGISTFELALGMKKVGHDVSVITTCRKKDEAGEVVYSGLRVFKIVTNYNPRWRAYVSLYNRPVVKEVRRILGEIKPDVVHANNIHYYISYHSLRIAKRYAKVVVLTIRDLMPVCYGKLETPRYLNNLNPKVTWLDNLKQAKKQYNPLRNFLIRRYLRSADRLFAISKSLQQALARNRIRNTEVIYNGIDASEWSLSDDAIKKFKTEYHLDGRQVLLFSGRLSASKGGAKAIEALGLIIQEVPNTVLLIAGPIDAYAKAMQRLAVQLNLNQHIIFTDWISRDGMKVAYAVSDVVLMTSICLDTFGRVNIEAMISKKPVVGTRYGGTPEIVQDGVTGYIVDPRNPEQIAKKTIDLLIDSQRALSFGNAGYMRVIQKFNLDDIVRQYAEQYESLLEST